MTRDADLVLGPRERERLLTVAGHSRSPYRDRALLQLFMHYGATVRQVLALEIGHVNFPAARLHWPTEGADTRLTAELLADLTRYVATERNPRCPALFTTPLGHPLDRQRVAAIFRRIRNESGLSVSPLLLRRGSLHCWLEEQPAQAVCGLIARRRAPSAGPGLLRTLP